MFARILWDTFRRRRAQMGIAMLSVVIGSSLVAALFSVSADLSDKVGRELRSYGANILVTPAEAGLQVNLGGVGIVPVEDRTLLDEDQLPKVKTIFWRNNILGFAPFLTTRVTIGDDAQPVPLTGTWFEKNVTLPRGTVVTTDAGRQSTAEESLTFGAGIKAISPWWKVRGDWVIDGDQAGSIVGASIAQRHGLRPGDTYGIRSGNTERRLIVNGVVTTGGEEDEQIFVNLPIAQAVAGVSKGVDRVLVSALTMPKEKLAADIRDKRPDEMTPKEYEKWYCSPTIDAVTTQIKEVVPHADAKPIRQFSEAEASFALKMQVLLVLVTGVALLASALGVMTTMTTIVLERRAEVGLMKAIGAENGQIALIFFSEAGVIGAIGGGVGYLLGCALADLIGRQVFGMPVSINLTALPVTLLLAVAVAVLGSALPVRRAMRVEPIILLRGG